MSLKKAYEFDQIVNDIANHEQFLLLKHELQDVYKRQIH